MFNNYEWFKAEVYKLTNIDLNFYKEKQMRRRIDNIATKCKCSSYEAYIEILKHDAVKFDEFINFLTINVSEFYRNSEQWNYMDKEVIPMILKNKSRVRIWSAACSTGDEPYSLAMAFSKHLPLSQIEIVATDIDKRVLESAGIGLYSEKSIENVPSEFKAEYFTKIGNSYQISDALKRCITFKEHNLLKDNYPDKFDLILCRNVVIYFTEEAKDMIYRKFYQSLAPNGVLFIGSTEQIINYRDLGYKRLSSFYFQK